MACLVEGESVMSVVKRVLYISALVDNLDLVLYDNALNVIKDIKVAVWRSWQRRWSDQGSCSTPGPVSTEMGDRIAVQLPMREVYLSLTNNSGQLSLAIPPCVQAQRVPAEGRWCSTATGE